MYPSVIDVIPLKDYKLKLKFDTGETKIFDISPYLSWGRFSELNDISLFRRVFVNLDSIEWPNGLDLDPEILYEKSEFLK